MKKLVSVTVVSLTMLVGGCSSVSSVYPFSRADYYDEKHIVAELDKKLSIADAWANNKLPGFVDDLSGVKLTSFDHSIKRSAAGGLTVDFTVKESPAYKFVKPGNYLIDHDSKAGKVLNAWLSQYVELLTDHLKKLNKDDYHITATVVGTADGIPYSKGKKRYRGEFGQVVVPSSAAIFNGENTRFSIKPGERLDNKNTAFLRAVGVSQQLNNLADTERLRLNYDIKTFLSRGEQYRFVKVFIQINKSQSG